jgi:hypothetical protein
MINIRFVSDIQRPSSEAYDELPVLITETAVSGLAIYSGIEDFYRESFMYLMRNCVGDKPDMLSSWYQKELALDKIGSTPSFDNIGELLADTPIGVNYGEVWRNHTLYGDQIMGLISNMVFNIYRQFTIYEYTGKEDDSEESIDISTFEPVMKTDYTHYYIKKREICAFVSADNLTIEEYVFHHNMRHMIMRFITQQKGMSGIVLGDISFLIKNFEHKKFKGKQPKFITLTNNTGDLFKDILNLS